MRLGIVVKSFLFCLGMVVFSSMGAAEESGEMSDDELDALLENPKTFVGSKNCKKCHTKQYYSWRRHAHSRIIQDPQADKRAFMADLDEKKIRKDLAQLDLKVPADKIYVPKPEEIKYTIGSRFKQCYVVEKNGTLYVAPIQYNAETGRFVNYHEADWDKRPFMTKCAGCHNTGIDMEKQSFVETSVSCEACHGKGSWHVAAPSTEFFDGEPAIVNPAKLSKGMAVQICGSCHNRGKSTKEKGVEWAIGYEPGFPLDAYFTSTSLAAGDKKHFYPNGYSSGNRQQYIDWKNSQHNKGKVTCISCHSPHVYDLEKSLPWQMAGTLVADLEKTPDKQCLSCHVMINKTGPHAIHSSAKCTGCHMPRIVKIGEYGEGRSHIFVPLRPRDTLKDPAVPNSCTSCHKHKDMDLKKLQKDAFPLEAEAANSEKGEFD